MADQKNRGGQKQGNQNPQQPEQAQGTTTQGAAERSDRDKQDQRKNPDDTQPMRPGDRGPRHERLGAGAIPAPRRLPDPRARVREAVRPRARVAIHLRA